MRLDIDGTLRGLLLELLSHLSFDGPKLSEGAWGTLESNLLNFCLENNIVTQEKVTKAVSMRLLYLGQNSLDAMKRASIPASKAASPQVLAYVIRYCGISAKEKDGIAFVDGVTAATFCPEIGEDFIQEVITMLRTNQG
jgi:hypothetical protein